MKSIYINQFNHTNTKSQQQFPFNLLNPFPTCLSPEGAIYALTYERSRVLNTILVYCRNYKLVYARRDTLAKKAKVSLSTFDRAVKYLAERGFLTVKNNGANKSCWYKVSKWFNDINVQEKLSKKLPIFYFSIKACLSLFVVGECRSINEEEYFIFKKPSYNNQSLTLERGKSDMTQSQLQISQKVKNLKLNLSIDEQIRLSQFPVAVLDAALLKLKNTKNIKLPSRYLIWLCNDICKNSNKKSSTVEANKGNDEVIEQNQNHATNSKFERVISKVKETRCPIMYMKLNKEDSRCTCSTQEILEQAITLKGQIKFWQSIERTDARYQFVNHVLPNLLNSFELLSKELQLRNISSQ